MAAKKTPRNTNKYEVRSGRIKIKAGITDDLERREAELKRELGDDIKLTKVGNTTTRKGALKWEGEQRSDLTYRD
ncbi:MAG: hypothetical protein HQ478_11310 [Chloroflexi bacterium]|nr:hypothetical protein [Chloroflexota bacterium]